MGSWLNKTPDTVVLPLTPQSLVLQSKLYFTIDIVEEGSMGSNWPRFPADYLESRRESIYDQICQFDLNVNGVHAWLLDRGPWISYVLHFFQARISVISATY